MRAPHTVRTLKAVWSMGLALLPLLVFGAAKAAAQGAPFSPPGLAAVATGFGEEIFVVRVMDQQLLDQMWDIAYNGAPPLIVIGEIRTGNDGYNKNGPVGQPWSWHLDEDTLGLAELTIELCDGLPSYVEADILGFGGGSFCPWSSWVVMVEQGLGIDADTNVDGVVDQTDADKVVECFTAVGERCVDIMPSCCQADIDSDLDVDCSDWAAIEEQWTYGDAPEPPQACVAEALPTLSTPWPAMLLVVSIGLSALYGGGLARGRAGRSSAGVRRRTR